MARRAPTGRARSGLPENGLAGDMGVLGSRVWVPTVLTLVIGPISLGKDRKNHPVQLRGTS